MWKWAKKNKQTNKQTNQQLLSKVYRELTREVNKLEMLTLYRINMRYWLRVKSRWFNIAWDEDEVNKKAKKSGEKFQPPWTNKFGE